MRQTRLTVLLLCHALAAAAWAHPPSGIVVDDGGAVYFQDGARGVWRVDPGPPAGAPGLVSDNALHWMALDPKGAFADAPESFGEWFWRATPRGHKPAIVLCSDFPCAVGTDGNLYYAKNHSLTVVRRSPAGAEAVLTTPATFGVAAERPVGVTGMAAGPDGTVYVVSLDSLNRDVGTGEHAVWAIAPGGAVRPFAKEFVKDLLPPARQHPAVRPQYCRGLAADADGNVFVAVTGNRCVMKLPPKGEPAVVLQCEKPWTPTGVAVWRGEVYVLEYDDETPTEGRNWPPRVRKAAADGKVTTVAAIKREARR
jgi:hypothetical protein